MRKCPNFQLLQASYASLLKQCETPCDLRTGKRVHAKIQADGLQADTFLANLVVQMYGKCGSIHQAVSTFQSIVRKNLFSYAILITALDQHGDFRAAIEAYRAMDRGLVPDDVTNVAILAACSKLGDVSAARLLHKEIVNRHIRLGTKVYNSLITMYTKCGSVEDAKGIFDQIPERNLISWNAMISAFARSGQSFKAVELLRRMENQGERPDRYTFCSIITACSFTGSDVILGASSCSSSLGATGRMIHERVILLGLECDVGVGTCLTSFYSKIGQIDQARRQFDKTELKNVVSWNAMLAAYATAGHLGELLKLYRIMEVEPDSTTYSIVLGACASSGYLEQGRRVHERLLQNTPDMITSDSIVQNSLLNLYAKCGRLDESTKVFESFCSKNTAAWNSLIAAHVQSGDPNTAANVYKRLLQTPDVMPDAFTFSTVLGAFTALGAIDEAALVHKEIVSRGFSKDEIVLKALLNTYAKCGNLENALEIFKTIKIRDTISWTSMILGYAQHCQVPQSLELFREMIHQGLSPDYVTYTSILHACGHEGLFHETLEILRWMERDYGIQRTLEHYHCVIDMLARLGQLDEAEELLKAISYEHESDTIAWISLLSGLKTQLDDNFRQQMIRSS
ncbi:pentatricopeptide repeat-containing protein At3g53360, mitochondrial [Selaginella moellendorffii]|uniref:pentatricopeptide repeat-containing protein At3g53360, mitochondrial n=1 Tax=Selaginella moellendorffii TaxID=88036 RepID=UPI000D1C4543|nr:pentatricopeptide repeat-containing protein At3g53360, mitochondrial [Selaginella moellendorffii]|eukprot:XP_024516012.1 pentatricopeptide repeat-containing protein At3g53360, mitochondrial [Selaginella moellendorffii]